NSNRIDLQNLSSVVRIEKEYAIEDSVVIGKHVGHSRCDGSELKSRSSRRRVVQECFVAVVTNEMEFVERMQHVQILVFVTLHLCQDPVHRRLYHPRWSVGSAGTFEPNPVLSHQQEFQSAARKKPQALQMRSEDRKSDKVLNWRSLRMFPFGIA